MEELRCINTLRCLSIDMVQKANSGHPGMPLGMAPAMHILYSRILKSIPAGLRATSTSNKPADLSKCIEFVVQNAYCISAVTLRVAFVVP